MLALVPVTPPIEGLVCAELADDPSVPVDGAEAARLYESAVADVITAVDGSGADLLVTYRDEETLPETVSVADPEAAVRELVPDGIDDTDVRFERQVGSSSGARIGNAVTHLIEREGVASVSVLWPTATLVRRPEIDGLAMSLRRRDVVLGPAERDRVSMAGFAAPVDFDGAFDPPQRPTLAARAVAADREVGFAPQIPRIDSEPGLCATVATIEARLAAEKPVPVETATTIDALGLVLEATESSGHPTASLRR